MCGICGVAYPDLLAGGIDPARVVAMRDQLTHRGPDGEGVFIDERVGLGHRRLSIIDVAHGAQPMRSADGRFHIVYNGEVYNHPALKARLESAGVHYETRCDTETVLHLYEREGPGAVRQLRGMFAIAIWDRQRRELFLARDRFGVKPLYYALLADGRLVFGSEVKSLLASGLVPARLNRRALPDYLANYATTGEDTLFEGVKRLPAGHTLSWRNGQVSIEQFWDLDLEAPTLTGSDDDLVEEYRERLTEAVRLRLMSDVPLGVFLSGGIDSAAITAIMTSLMQEPVKSFSVAFNEREANELAYARMVSGRFGTDHHEVTLSREDFFGALPRMIWHEDEPIAHPSSIPLYFVSRLAAEHVKVVLTGEGSDETLAGYNRYRVALLNLQLGRMYQGVMPGPLRRLGAGAIGALPASTARRRLLRTFLALPADLDSLYFANFSVFSPAWQARLLAPGMRTLVNGIDPFQEAHRALARWGTSRMLDRLLYADMKTYLHELLMKQDQMSMAASIESRVPFLDHPLVEWSMRLPPHLKLRGLTTKVVLRRAMAGILPAEILTRKKMGFPVPVGTWFRGASATWLRDIVLSERALARGLFDPAVVRELVETHQRGTAQHTERLWMLLNLELWQRMFLDGEPAEGTGLALAGMASA